MKFDFSSLSQGESLRVIGNLPYNISTPLLFHLFEYSFCVRDMHFMLQKEVVDRLCAEPGDKEYGRLGVMAQLLLCDGALMDVFPGEFQSSTQSDVFCGAPGASSRPGRSGVAPDILSRVVAAAFSQRRKTLRNAMSLFLPVK